MFSDQFSLFMYACIDVWCMSAAALVVYLVLIKTRLID